MSMASSRLPVINADINLIHYQSQRVIPIEQVWSKSPCILFVLRSASCFMCRRMTKLMMDNKQKFLDFGIELYFILKENVGAEEFINQYLDSSINVYIDPEFELYRILGDNGAFRYLNAKSTFKSSLWSNMYNALAEGHKFGGNFASQNTILGGTCLVSETGEIIYRDIEFVAGDMPNIKGLLDACHALFNQDEGEAAYNEAMRSPDKFKMLGFDFSNVRK